MDYDWDENRIYVSGYVATDLPDLSEEKAACEALIFFMSDVAAVDNNTGRPMSALNSSSFSQRFGHVDYESTSRPKDYQTRLDQIFVLRAFVGAPGKLSTKCHRQLLSTEIYFAEKD